MISSVQDAIDSSLAFLAAVERMDEIMEGQEWHTMPYLDFLEFMALGEVELAQAIQGFTDLCRSMGVELQKEAKQ